MDYDYREAITEDVKEYVMDHYTDEDLKELDRDDLESTLNDDLFTEDSVTGNASGSYTCNAYRAHEYIDGDNNAEDYIRELIDEYCLSAETIAEHLFDWEYWDVSIRCYLLGQCISDALDDLLEDD